MSMKRSLVSAFAFCGLLCSVAHAHFMSSLWPQKGLADSEQGPSTAPYRVLIAGTTSDFRSTVVAVVADSLVAGSVFVKTTSFRGLTKEDPSSWNAVVIANTCIAWDIENRARNYIEKHPDYRGFVMLLTSGDPDSCCPSSKLPSGIDAISTASVAPKLPSVIAGILARIRTVIWGSAEPVPQTDGTTGATRK
jgi:hypothetical protein